MGKNQFIPKGKMQWELPASSYPHMNVPVVFFADEDILQESMRDASVDQAVNAACLPSTVGRVVVMPDVHQGYGFPIGGIAATQYPQGVISPGAIGYDINCGVRLLAGNFTLVEIRGRLDDLANALYRNCPAGMGREGNLNLDVKQMKAVCETGAGWALKAGMALPNDLELTEDSGCLEGADFSKCSQRAIERGRAQLGTLGSGNHFIEVDVVTDIYNEAAAGAMGLRSGAVTIQIHCGSRGLGHQVCTDYVREYQALAAREKYYLPDRELVYAGITTPQGTAYLGAMKCAANFAFANRQVLAFYARRAFEEVFGINSRYSKLAMVYDLAHNIGKIEMHLIDGETRKVCVHRKGATRALGPGSSGVPLKYRHIGQPVFIPGSMGTSSWVLTGTTETSKQSFGSLCHGAGRVMSRQEAKKKLDAGKLQEEMDHRGVRMRYQSRSGLVEEAPQAYKDVDRVIEVVVASGLAVKVARMEPVIVIKG